MSAFDFDAEELDAEREQADRERWSERVLVALSDALDFGLACVFAPLVGSSMRAMLVGTIARRRAKRARCRS